MTYDNFFKELLRDFLGGSCQVERDVRVGTLPLQVDAVLLCPDPDPVHLPTTLLAGLLAPVNVLEYKSGHDRTSKTDLTKLVGYVGLYCQSRCMGIDGMASCAAWYVTAAAPSFLGPLLGDGLVVATTVPGLYGVHGQVPCPFHIVVVNELEPVPGNMPFLLLASGPAMRGTIKLVAARAPLQTPLVLRYLRMACDHNYKDVRGMTELNELIPEWKKENIHLLVEDLGMKAVVEALGIDAVVDAIDLTDLNAALQRRVKQAKQGPESKQR